jgi:hypothetical protein
MRLLPQRVLNDGIRPSARNGREMSDRGRVSAGTITQATAKVSEKTADPLDRVAQAILGAVHRTASDAKTRNQQSLKVTHRLSAEMQATEDRIRELEAKVRHHEERADRAEKWLYRITLEIEQQLLGREQGLSLQPPPL